MLRNVRYFVVEDREQSVRSVLQQARLAGFQAELKIGVAGTLSEATSVLNERWKDIDLVFLDLNIPAEAGDSHPRKDHGQKLLEVIHNDINRRGEHSIAVIIISGEVDSEAERQLWVKHYAPTVLDLASKDNLTEDFRRCVQRYFEDPMKVEIRSIWPEGFANFDVVTDPSKSANDRSLAAIQLGCLMLKNIDELESAADGLGASSSSDLNTLIKEYLGRNFEPVSSDRPAQVYSNLRKLKRARDQWVLRGYIVEHLYSIHKYRNAIIHVSDTGPFHDGRGGYGVWDANRDLISRLESAERTCKIIQLVVEDVVEWYLPWHERVYLAWKGRTK